MLERSSITIGTRGSRLALAQTEWVADVLRRAHPYLTVSIRKIVTRGDRQKKAALPEIGGKGLFTAELEAALQDWTIDVAVHSAKDLPTTMPEGLVLVATPVRQDVRDALIARSGRRLADLPEGAVIGTSSLRRQAQLRARRPDLRFTVLRGNVDTRIRKVLGNAPCEATVLAMAGLIRIGLVDRVTEVLDLDVMLPAAGQGALALQGRADDQPVRQILLAVQHAPTYAEVMCERRVIHLLEGGCQAPVGVCARAEGDRLICRAVVISPEGGRHIRTTSEGRSDDWTGVADLVVKDLLRNGAANILHNVRR